MSTGVVKVVWMEEEDRVGAAEVVWEEVKTRRMRRSKY